MSVFEGKAEDMLALSSSQFDPKETFCQLASSDHIVRASHQIRWKPPAVENSQNS